MTDNSPNTPSLVMTSQCDRSLDFSPLSKWPESLPAVAVNKVLVAGFQQALAFNHEIDFQDSQKFVTLFRSLYFDLTYVELVKLLEKSERFSWFPAEKIISSFGFQCGPQFLEIGKLILRQPETAIQWACNKKLGPQDLACLTSASDLNLMPVWEMIIFSGASKSTGVQILELAIELLLMGKLSEEDLHSNLSSSPEKVSSTNSDKILLHLKSLRYPETFAKDHAEQEKLTNLPWAGSTQVRWSRNGDRSGIEVKFFISQPSDLKKQISSLSQVHDAFERALLKNPEQ